MRVEENVCEEEEEEEGGAASSALIFSREMATWLSSERLMRGSSGSDTRHHTCGEELRRVRRRHVRAGRGGKRGCDV